MALLLGATAGFIRLQSALIALFLVAAVSAGNCTKPIVRKEWRTLTTHEKQSYLRAVQCILAKPALTAPFPESGVISRYDDLVYTHIQQTFNIHYVGHFLAWHRYFTATYETMLRRECCYTGAQPYWDWTLDVVPSSSLNSTDSDEKWPASPVFDAETGFGGNGPFVAVDPSNPFAVPGRTGGGCVSDGPWAGKDDVVHLGPQSNVTYNPQCLKRDLSPAFAARYLSINQTRLTLAQSDFGWFDRVVEGGPSFDTSGVHGGGHYSVGGTLGQMGDLYASPSDPIFFMHHANLDRVWWSWQALNLSARLTDISGPINLMDYNNTHGGNVTLSFPISLGVSAPNVTVGDVMDIGGGGGDGIMCYTYDELYTLDD